MLCERLEPVTPPGSALQRPRPLRYEPQEGIVSTALSDLMLSDLASGTLVAMTVTDYSLCEQHPAVNSFCDHREFTFVTRTTEITTEITCGVACINTTHLIDGLSVSAPLATIPTNQAIKHTATNQAIKDLKLSRHEKISARQGQSAQSIHSKRARSTHTNNRTKTPYAFDHLPLDANPKQQCRRPRSPGSARIATNGALVGWTAAPSARERSHHEVSGW